MLVLHLGDHDPSGLDMTRDNRERLHLFSRDNGQGRVVVKRIALTREQIEQYRPPHNPAKESDTRYMLYSESNPWARGRSWELDALDPTVIDTLIDAEVQTVIDRKRWDAALNAEGRGRQLLHRLSERWSDLQALLSG